jgi:hypothetical protein
MNFTIPIGTKRWAIGKEATAETGSNVGSDFHVYRYTDAGGFLGQALSIQRSTGNAVFSSQVHSQSGGFRFPDGTTQTTADKGQTPWTGNVDAAGFNLSNLRYLYIANPGGTAGNVVRLGADGNTLLLTGETDNIRLYLTGGFQVEDYITCEAQIWSKTVGFKFPDSTIQTTAATGGGSVTGVLTVAAFDTATSSGTVRGGYDVVHLSDGLYTCVWDGAAWQYYFGDRRVYRPVNSAFAWINQSTSSVTTTSGGIYLLQPFAATQYLAIRKRAAPATPYTITVLMIPNPHPTGNLGIGLCFGDGTKIVTHAVTVSASNVINLVSEKWNSATAYNAAYGFTISNNFPHGAPVYLRISDDGTNRKYSLSFDGFNFREYHSIGHTDFLTPTEVGFFVKAQNGAQDAGVMLVSWQQS